MKYVAYFRVSTKEQGCSGLGLQSQKQNAFRFAKAQGGTIISEFEEVESGKNNERIELEKAIRHAKQNDATLLIAKLDRLSRNAAFIFKLRDEKVKFVCVDLPDANTMTIGIFATFAQHEAEVISQRTVAALREKKRRWLKSELDMSLEAFERMPKELRVRITKRPDYPLGAPHKADFAKNEIGMKARRRSIESKKRAAANNENWRRAAGYICTLRDSRASYAAIAERLGHEGFKTARGCAFSAMTVRRLYLKNCKQTEA